MTTACPAFGGQHKSIRVGAQRVRLRDGGSGNGDCACEGAGCEAVCCGDGQGVPGWLLADAAGWIVTADGARAGAATFFGLGFGWGFGWGLGFSSAWITGGGSGGG